MEAIYNYRRIKVNNQLSATEKNLLLKIAREAIVNYIMKGSKPALDVSSESLLTKQGCFVTIKHKGSLRGCLGQFTSDKPLCQLVQEMAIAAATHDPRFYPMVVEDLQNFDLEISILSPIKKIDSIDEIEVGVHGLYIEKNSYRGVLLPQVATEYGWDRLTFLSQTCLKAGLDKEAWKDDADIHIFSAQVIEEK
jgi:AmmeMemoRadiSam system protein A